MTCVFRRVATCVSGRTRVAAGFATARLPGGVVKKWPYTASGEPLNTRPWSSKAKIALYPLGSTDALATPRRIPGAWMRLAQFVRLIPAKAATPGSYAKTTGEDAKTTSQEAHVGSSRDGMSRRSAAAATS